MFDMTWNGQTDSWTDEQTDWSGLKWPQAKFNQNLLGQYFQIENFNELKFANIIFAIIVGNGGSRLQTTI